jgi:hypothetical protein
MRLTGILAISCILLSALQAAEPPQQPRLIVTTDIGGDPDDSQSMVRLLVHANEFEIEGLIASAAGVPGELKQDIVKPELIRERVEAYGKVRPNLLRHSPDFPPAEELLARIKRGNPHRGVANLGEGKDTEGSNWIIAVVDRLDPRPVNIAIWGGSTELAQALWRVRHDRTPAELEKFLGKIRVHAIEHQDDTGPWILQNFPQLFYILSKAPEGRKKLEGVYRGMYLGGDETLTSRAWIDGNVRKEHGPLGALYPNKAWTAPNPNGTLKEGDTPSWFYFLPNGLGDPAHPEWGGWGGRFRHQAAGLYRDAEDTVEKKTVGRATVWRWRPAYQAEFQARMDWCVKAPGEANHAPLAVVDGRARCEAICKAVRAGERVALSAAGSSDPDRDRLDYWWWVYPEAGTYPGAVQIEASGRDEHKEKAVVAVPRDAAGKQIHVILEVTDDGVPRLKAYRRVVLDVKKD